MDLKALGESLHPLERRVLPFLKQEKDIQKIVEKSKMLEVEVMRAVQMLEQKQIVTIETKESQKIVLGANAQKYVREGLPEKRFLESLDKPLTLQEIKQKAKLSDEEANVSIGLLKRKNAIKTLPDKILKFEITPEGKKFLKEMPEENVLKRISANQSLSNEEKRIAEEFKKRKDFIQVETEKQRTIALTSLGEKLANEKLDTTIIDALTVDLIKSGRAKNAKFRPYDVTISTGKMERGKRHFVDQAVDYAKRIWLDLGFKEMEGAIAHTEFWDLDALFVPQDHPAREMQDTFFVGKNKEAALGTIPQDLAKKIKAVHENGWTTGSKGWGGTWDEHLARKILLRTHTTVLSAKTLSNLKKEDLPAKFFSIGKVYRNESLDWKHLFEFHQVEGIVVDPNANFRHLLGYLKEFFGKMGFKDVRIKPSFFGYTEPSAEIEVLHPERKEWVELGGAGIFRPEVTKPLLGFECPVLAWGFGFERIITQYYKIQDIRELYKNNLKFTREVKDWMK